MANMERMYTKEQKAVALERLVFERSGKMNEEYETMLGQFTERTVAELSSDSSAARPMSFTNGPAPVLTTSKEFSPKEETVSRSMFNFIDALKLKDIYGYTLAEALAVAYEKNELVNALGDLSYTIEETQSARITEADKYPWPVSSCVKFSASFAKETAGAVLALMGNGFFAAGSAATMLFDSVVNPKDAGDNFVAMGEVVMGALFHSTRYMGSTIKNEDIEVSAGLLASFVIAPEEAVLERGGKIARAARMSNGAKKTASKAARREGEIGMELSERTAIKSMEGGELGSLADLMEKQGRDIGAEWGNIFVEVSELDSGEGK
jgi:hypothetical protein